MRPLEIALLLANVPLLAWCLSGRALPGWARIPPAVAILALALQVVFEGARWHMGPGYLVTVCLFFACCWPRGVELGWWAAALGIGALLAAAALGTVLPVFELPKPTGDYP